MMGKIVKFMRISKNIKQSELAKMTHIASSTISNYEIDSISISAENLRIIAEACNYEILFKDKENNKIYKIDDVKRFPNDIRAKK